MMTRKHYNKLAEILNQLHTDLKMADQNPSISFGAAVSRLSNVLREDNPNFDSARFRDAVYQKPELTRAA